MPTVKSRSRWAGVPPEERQASRRQLLIETAFDLLGTEGDAGTTVRAVCQKARLNPRYFYESFADRDELLVAVYDAQVSRLGDLVLTAVAAAGDDPAATTRAGIETIVRFVAEDPRQAKVLYSEALGNEAVNRRRLESAHAVVGFLVGWAEERGARRGEHINLVAGSILVGGMGELLLAWLEGRIPMTLEQLIDDAVALFLATGEAAARIAAARAT